MCREPDNGETLMTMSLLVLSLACVAPCPAAMSPNLVTGEAPAPQRGVYEIALVSDGAVNNPYLDSEFKVAFTRPDASRVTVDGFYDGAASGQAVFKARAYCDYPGAWSWTSSSRLPDLDGRSGAFTVAASELPGKLRKHPDDPHQFAYDNGEWFLHIGDTGYRYVVDTEPEWQAYIDQAAKMGATKIRAWFCRARSGVAGLFAADRTALNLPYWQEIDRRVQYALNKHPQIILQLIPYGEDTDELLRYGQADPMSRLVAQYAQARLSAFPNVIWCISNDQKIAGDGAQPGEGRVPAAIIDGIGRDMAAREPWGTLLTNHQARHTGYAFTDAPWSDIATLEDLDQVHGALLLEYREKANDPAINDEDRYELYRPPAHPRYFFRRLMWASLLSGGSATYGGAQTYEPYNGRERGVRGYYDLKKEGILNGGADDFTHIHRFFKQAALTLVGMRPADAMAGGDSRVAKVIAGERAAIVYLPNPDSETPEKADAATTNAVCRLQLPPGDWSLRWFNPRTGEWFDEPGSTSGGSSDRTFTAPFAGDAVLTALLAGS
jgi:hypothetical protein